MVATTDTTIAHDGGARTSATPTIDLAALTRAVCDVPDPEMPAVTIGMLGMVYHLDVVGDEVVVELLPTFSGCPATDLIGEDVTAAAQQIAGVGQVTVTFRHDPPWTADRIDDDGREALRRFGIAPPGGIVAGSPRPDGRPTLPIAARPASASTARSADAAPATPCPYCGSTNTVRDAFFGPTPCRDVRYCNSCAQPFEAFKS